MRFLTLKRRRLRASAVLVTQPPHQDSSGYGSQKQGPKSALTEPIPQIKSMEEREDSSYRRWLTKANRPIVWRFLTFLLSTVAFATISSAKYCACLTFFSPLWVAASTWAEQSSAASTRPR